MKALTAKRAGHPVLSASCASRLVSIVLPAVSVIGSSVVRVAVVCAGEGPLRPLLEQRIAYLGLREIVRLAGHVPDVPGLLARAHAAWTPGLRATVEAMAAGVPVASPWRELIGADLAVGRGDPAALAGRLLALLRDRKVGTALRKRAEKDYSLDAFRARLRVLYDAVLAEARVAA